MKYWSSPRDKRENNGCWGGRKTGKCLTMKFVLPEEKNVEMGCTIVCVYGYIKMRIENLLHVFYYDYTKKE